MSFLAVSFHLFFVFVGIIRPSSSTSGLQIYIRTHDGMPSLELSSSATARDLYDKVDAEIGLHKGESLTFAGKQIKNDKQELADLGVVSEAVISMAKGPSDAEMLYELFQGFVNRERIRWWYDAQQCHQQPEHPHCSNQWICRGWPNIVCNARDEIIQVYGDYHNLMGELKLASLPQTVEILHLPGNLITGLDMRGLKGKELVYLRLYENDITELNLSGIAGSKLKHLRIAKNKISKIDFEGLAASQLRELELNGNRIIREALNTDQISKSMLEEHDKQLLRVYQIEF